MTAEPFLDHFARAILARAFGRAEAMLAPWIRNALPGGGLKAVVQLARGDAPPASDVLLSSLPHNDPASMREKVDEHSEEEGDRSLMTTDGTGGLYGPPSFPIPDELTADYAVRPLKQLSPEQFGWSVLCSTCTPMRSIIVR